MQVKDGWLIVLLIAAVLAVLVIIKTSQMPAWERVYLKQLQERQVQ